MKTSILAGMALVIGTALAGPAAAQSCGYEYCWGAVGIGPNGAWGWTTGQFSEDDAISRVRQECGHNCDNIKTFYNTCGSMASGPSGNWGFGWAGTRYQAEQNALSACYDYGPNCNVRVWACSQ